MSAFQIFSQDLIEGKVKDKKFSFNGFGHDGDNVSPQLAWENAPEGTKSFAVTCFDPDAPTESGFWHWQVINLPATCTELPQGISGHLSAGLEMRNDYGFNGFGGACPPIGHGMHRYQFTVWALPVEKLDVPDDASCALVSFMLHGMSLAHSTLTPTYIREEEAPAVETPAEPVVEEIEIAQETVTESPKAASEPVRDFVNQAQPEPQGFFAKLMKKIFG